MADLGLPEISNLLQLRYDKNYNQIIFNNDVDATMAYFETVKADDGGGAGFVVQFQTEGSVLASPDYELAGGVYGAYTMTVTCAYINWRATVSKLSLDGVKGKGGAAQFNVFKSATDMALHRTVRKIGRHLVSRHGELGIIAAVSGSTVTIGSGLPTTATANPVMVNRVRGGMVLVAALDPNSGALRAGEGTVATATAPNQNTGVITLTGAFPAAWVVGDTLFEKGDRFATATVGTRTQRRTLTGLKGWLDPTAAAGSENFYALDRSTAPELQPIRYDATGVDLRVALLRMQQLLFTNGSHASIAFISPIQWTALMETIDATQVVNMHVEKESNGKTFTIGFKAIELAQAGGGTLKIIQSAYIESGIVWMGPFDNKEEGFKLYFTDKLIRLDMQNGVAFTRVEGGVTDSVTSEKVAAYRAEGDFRGAVVCKAPGKYLVATGFTGI